MKQPNCACSGSYVRVRFALRSRTVRSRTNEYVVASFYDEAVYFVRLFTYSSSKNYMYPISSAVSQQMVSVLFPRGSLLNPCFWKVPVPYLWVTSAVYDATHVRH